MKEQVRLLYTNSLAANLTVICAGLLVALSLSILIQTPLLLYWLITLVCAAGLRILIWRAYMRLAQQIPQSVWVRRYIWATLFVGIAWSGLCVLLLVSDELHVHYIVIAMILAVISVSVPVLSASMPAFFAYVLPQALVLSATLLIEGDPVSQIISLVVMVYTALTTVIARNMHRHIMHSLQLQQQNQGLIEKLNQEIDQRKAAQQELERHGEQLEELVNSRTVELVTTNRDLQKEITDRKRAEENLKQLAHHDPLTNLPNRLLLDARLEHAISRSQRNHTQLAVLFMDLDQFKHINDSLGHVAGDELLRLVARRLQTSMRANDTLARLGGDEFVIVIEQMQGKRDVQSMAEKVMELFSWPFRIQQRELYIGASIGISLYPQDGMDSEELLMHADTAMYLSKKAGRHNFHFYTQELTASAYERMTLESSLRQALEMGEMRVYYQPQILLADSRIAGVEALVRWEHPEFGLLSPARFLKLAEETGLILPIGRWVLQQACRQMSQWRARGFILERMAVNLSARQVHEENLVELVEDILRETACQPNWLELEITESFIMQETDRSIQALDSLKALGVHLAIDDFGTGYSSLSYLKRLPVMKVKIDRSFIRDLASAPNDAAIVSAVIAMGQSLNLEITAEGVEETFQAEFLKQQGCHQAQGFLYSQPAPAVQIEDNWADRIDPAER